MVTAEFLMGHKDSTFVLNTEKQDREGKDSL